METQEPKEGHTAMKVHSRILRTLVALSIPVLCAAISVISVRATTTGGSAADTDRWISIGPAPIRRINQTAVSGRVTAVAVDPAVASHWLIGTATGGVWETRDAGSTWTAKTDDQAALAIGAVAFAPSDPGVVYAGTGEGNFAQAGEGLLKSTDGGGTWTMLAAATFARTAFSAIQVDPTNANVLLATTLHGAVGRPPFGVLLAAPISPPRGIFKSTDDGGSWSQRLNGEATDLKVRPQSFNNQYAGLGELTGSPVNGVYRSTDAGETWTLIDGPWSTMEGGVGRVELAIAPSNPNVLYTSIGQRAVNATPFQNARSALLGLFRTDNAWDPTPAWRQIPTAATDDGTGTHGYCGWDLGNKGAEPLCHYAHCLSVDPTDADVLYAGGIPLWKFDGTAWTEVSQTASNPPQAIHVDQHSLVWAGNRLIVGNDGGVWSTEDAGATWTDHNTNLAITQFYKGALHPTNPNFVVAGTQDNGFVKWTGTETWQYFYDSDGLDIAISTSHPDTRWALTAQFLVLGQTVVSFGGRVTVVPAGRGIDVTDAPFAARFEKCPANEDVLIAGTSRLWRTTEFFSAPLSPGPTWSANGPEMGECTLVLASPAPAVGGCVSALGFAPSDTTCRTYAFATGDGRLRRTVDGGSTWDDLDASHTVPGRLVTDLAFDPADANILYVTLSGFDESTPGQPGHVFKTSNALAAAPTWSNVSPPPNLPQNTIAIDPVDSQVVYLGADAGVWKSTDGAGTWTHVGPDSGMPNAPVYDLEIHAATRRPFAFTYGRGAFVTACRSDADCNDQNPSNGVETCDLASGRCQAGVAPPTASATATPSATTAPTGTATPTASATLTNTATPTATRTASPTVTVSFTPVATATPSLTPAPTQTHTAAPTSTPTQAQSANGSGCAIVPAQHTDAIAGVLWLWIVPLLWRARRRNRRALAREGPRKGEQP
ncbi:MAG: WD40/YVTN/BNR-like repeat-containing protein [Candidatus Binatia bacterium]